MDDVNKWVPIGDTNIYTTGHVVVSEKEILNMIESKIFEKEKSENINEKRILVAKLKNENKIKFYFFPLDIQGKYLMEVNISKSLLDKIEILLPKSITTILSKRDRVKYSES